MYKTGTWGIQAKERSRRRREKLGTNIRAYIKGRTIQDRALIYKAKRHEIKNEIYKLLGAVCIKCGFNDIRALQIDHKYGGGSKERRSIGYKFYPFVLDSLLKKEGKYQILCANCNFIKRYENNEMKGRKGVI